MEFDLQRFAEENSQDTNAESETQVEESPIPEELNGLPEEIARETLAEWKDSQPKTETQAETQVEETQPKEEPITREQYQAVIDEVNKLKAQLAETQKQSQPTAQVQRPQPQFQPPQLRLTQENAKLIDNAITAEAMKLSGMSKDDVASLDYADDDDPRISQWNQAKRIAENRVYNTITQMQAVQQQQAQKFYTSHAEAVNSYNEFAKKEFAEPDYKEIQQFATNEFFERLSAQEQQVIANSYLRVEKQIASPAEVFVVKKYYEMAKAAYRTRGAKQKTATNKSTNYQLPKSDQLKGSSTAGDGRLSNSDIEKLLQGDFTKLDEKTRNFLLGMS